MSYTAYNVDGGLLPSWITFDNSKLKFYGVTLDPVNVKTFNLGVRVIDSYNNLGVEVKFKITLTN